MYIIIIIIIIIHIVYSTFFVGLGLYGSRSFAYLQFLILGLKSMHMRDYMCRHLIMLWFSFLCSLFNLTAEIIKCTVVREETMKIKTMKS